MGSRISELEGSVYLPKLASQFLSFFRHVVHPMEPRYVLFGSSGGILAGQGGKEDRLWGVFDSERFYVYVLSPYVFPLRLMQGVNEGDGILVNLGIVMVNIFANTSAPLVLFRDGTGVGRLGLRYDLLVEVTLGEGMEEQVKRFVFRRLLSDYHRLLEDVRRFTENE